MEQIINQAFAAMIGKYKIWEKIGITRPHVKSLRYQVKHGVPISMDKKFRLLRKSGWQPDHHRWTDADVAGAIRFALQQGKAAKQMGPQYLFEKWVAQPKTK